MHATKYFKELSEDELKQYASKIEVVLALASDVAHDFSDILQSLRFNIELILLNENENYKNYKYLEAIYEAVIRGSDITSRLSALALSTNESSNNKNTTICNINKELVLIQKIINRNIPDRIEIEYDIQEIEELSLIDPKHIEQILINLVLNSVEAIASSGKIVIEIKSIYLDSAFCIEHKNIYPGKYLELSVSDNGIGISDTIINHIFDPFFSTKSKKSKGSLLAVGLGLYTVSKIVKNYKGIIDVKNKPNTTITIYIPLLSSIVENINEIDIEESIKIGKETILILDDNCFVSKTCSNVLNVFGYSTINFDNTNKAFDYYLDNLNNIHLSIIDLVMPGTSGKQYIKNIKKINKKHKTIITTGYSLDDKQRQELLDLGVDDIITKPYTIEVLLKKVRKVLDS